MRSWHVPTFSIVFADVDGHIGYQAAGLIPIRQVWERGYRPGWEPKHQWDGLIPFEGMPGIRDPERGWIATANNRAAPEDFPYPLSGTWSDGLRAGRIRQMMEAQPVLGPEECGAMQRDTLSLRAQRALPALLPVLATAASPRIQEALGHLHGWDGRMETDRVGATLFEAFFSRWVRRVIRERFDGDATGLLAGGGAGLAASLLHEDPAGWFAPGRREPAIVEAMSDALDYLATRLGPDMASWAWGRLHSLPLRHVLSGRGDLGQLLDHGGLPVGGNAITVCNTSPGAQLEARLGGNYRLVADLGSAPPTLLAIDGEGQSGHPGSPHYGDQLANWLQGRLHALVLEDNAGTEAGWTVLTLEAAAG
jgi:penicillin amidase